MNKTHPRYDGQHIYVLEEQGIVRYVGATNYPSRRLAGHRHAGRLIDPTLRILCVVELEDSLRVEEQVTELYRRRGAILLNILAGREGRTLSADAKRRIGEANRARTYMPRTPEQCENISRAVRKVWEERRKRQKGGR